MRPVYRRAPHKNLPLEQVYHTADLEARAKATASPPHNWGSSPDACGGLFSVSATAICVDACSPRDLYFSDLEPIAVRIMTPCVVLAVLALAIFLA